ncbi:helix-turn-helix domain-containing protein [Pseudoteredinibacter isoporae]|uniref:helix-turn-helix domain-containing protein n=1 Tax=Pseudoteredinibacter isoporae TaxID=570281 RepID=UPI0031064C77
MDTTKLYNSPRVFTEQETSRYIGMSRSYLRQARMEGNRENRTPAPPFIKIGRSIRYLREDLDRWIDELGKYDHLGQVQ